MARPECDASENIVRALTTAHWDEDAGRIKSLLFTGPNTSVSRLAVLGLSEIFEIFQRDLGPYPQTLLGAGEINIGELQRIGRTYEDKPREITVEEAPLHNNPAHAEIPQKLSRGLALRIIEHLQMHRP